MDLAKFTIKLKDLVSPQLDKMSKRFGITNKSFNSSVSSMDKGLSSLSRSIKNVPSVEIPTRRPIEELDRLERKANSLDKRGGKSLNSFKSKAKGLGNLGRAFQGKGLSSLGSSLRFAGAGLNPVVAGIGLATVGAYKLGRAVNESSVKMQKNLEITNAYINSNNLETKALTAQATALSKVYGSDYTETVKTASLLAKRFGINNKEAFSVIQKGLASGANIEGGLLKHLEEHSEAFKNVGATAAQQVTIMQQSTLKGIGNVPKLLESFSSNIPNIGGNIKHLLDGNFGEGFAATLKQNLSNGKITILEALNSISSAVSNSALSQKETQNIASQIFGDNSDNAVRLLNNFHSYENSLDKIVSKNGAFNKVKSEQYKLEQQIANSQLQSSKRVTQMSDKINLLGLRIKATFYNNLGGILDYIDKVKRFGNSLYNLSKKIGLVKLGTGILNTMYNGLVGLMDGLANAMDWVSNKIGGAKQKKYKSEPYKESPFIKSIDSLKNTPLVLAVDKLDRSTKANTKTLDDKWKHKNSSFDFPINTNKKDLSSNAKEQLSTGINSITTGGSQVRNLSVNIQSMIDKLEIHSTVAEASGEIQDTLKEMFVKVLQGGETSLNRG